MQTPPVPSARGFTSNRLPFGGDRRPSRRGPFPSTAPTRQRRLSLDEWACVVLFCDGRVAMRLRGVAHVLHTAVDLACHRGLLETGRVALADMGGADPLDLACMAALQQPRLPAWLGLVGKRSDVVEWFAGYGHVDALDRMAGFPFCAGRGDAAGWSLRAAASAGHVAVMDRLALPPYSLGQKEARTGVVGALLLAAEHGHVAVLDRLALPPFSLGEEDARVDSNDALRSAARCGHVAVLDRLALPPYSLGEEDARACSNYALRSAAQFGYVAILDRLALPPYSLGQEDARVCDNYALRYAACAAVLDRLAEPPFSLGPEDVEAAIQGAPRGIIAAIRKRQTRPCVEPAQ